MYENEFLNAAWGPRVNGLRRIDATFNYKDWARPDDNPCPTNPQFLHIPTIEDELTDSEREGLFKITPEITLDLKTLQTTIFSKKSGKKFDFVNCNFSTIEHAPPEFNQVLFTHFINSHKQCFEHIYGVNKCFSTEKINETSGGFFSVGLYARDQEGELKMRFPNDILKVSIFSETPENLNNYAGIERIELEQQTLFQPKDTRVKVITQIIERIKRPDQKNYQHAVARVDVCFVPAQENNYCANSIQHFEIYAKYQ